MPKIIQLSPHEAQKIAAGQVVERAAHVVKELLENALDAQATHISLHIQEGGKKLIRVVDNGYGMDHEDAQHCFQKHATSKIRSIEELATLTTFGFRGEALACIAAVASVTLKTKQQNLIEGITVSIEQGAIETHISACQQGTDITIENLFYNVPARAKFIKKKETETRHIIQTIKAIGVAYPHLHLELFVDKKQIFNCPGNKNIIARYAQLWDTTTAEHMIPLMSDHSQKEITISGAISTHQWFRYDRSGIFLFVNGRWITNHHISRALLKGYNNVLQNGHYPLATIAIFIDPAQVDINCHPRKEEVLFRHPRIVEQLIQESVRTTLEQHLSTHLKKKVTLAIPASESYPAILPPFLSNELADPLEKKSQAALIPLAQTSTHNKKSALIEQNSALPLFDAPLHTYTIIGQLHTTYILLEKEDGLYIIDQHAAHERILYELFAYRFEKVPTVSLMFPQLIACNHDDVQHLQPYLAVFAQLGIALDVFGKDQFIIQSLPVYLKNTSMKETILQAIGWIKESSFLNEQDVKTSLQKNLQAQMACKAAVKAGDILNPAQMEELINDLYATPNRFSCPHGRPTGWLISRLDLERKFQRRK